MEIKLCGVTHRAPTGPGGLGQSAACGTPTIFHSICSKGGQMSSLLPQMPPSGFSYVYSPRSKAVNPLKEGFWVVKEGNHIAPWGHCPMGGGV